MNDINVEVAETYRQALQESVHVSFKTTNSNIEKGGVRLNIDQLLDLPYVSARTLLVDDIYIPVDYQANAGKTATLFKTIKAAALNEPPEEADEQTLAELGFVASLLPDLKKQALVAGDKHIDVRMRQLLIPKDDGYISLSPLTAAGLCHIVNIEVDAVKQRVESLGKDAPLNKLKTALIGIGGSNIQNVGSLVKAMRQPVLVSAPQLNKYIRKALAIYHQGFDYHFNGCAQDFKDYERMWWEQSSSTQRGSVPSAGIYSPKTDMVVRNEGMESHPRLIDEGDERLKISELDFIVAVVKSVLAQGEQHFLYLKKYEDFLPFVKGQASKWSDPSVDYVTQGLINKEFQRRDDWQHLFAVQLTQRIINHRHPNGIKVLSADDNAAPFFVRLIKRMLP